MAVNGVYEVMPPGYARNLRTGVKGDVTAIYDHVVIGTTHETQRPFKWKLGLGNIELIEFGSFNPKNKNYKPGGKVIAVK